MENSFVVFVHECGLPRGGWRDALRDNYGRVRRFHTSHEAETAALTVIVNGAPKWFSYGVINLDSAQEVRSGTHAVLSHVYTAQELKELGPATVWKKRWRGETRTYVPSLVWNEGKWDLDWAGHWDKANHRFVTPR